MTIKVTEALDSDIAEKVTIIRQVKGAFEDGIFIEGREVYIKALASVQPATSDQLKVVPEGERTTDTKAMYINKRVYGSGNEDQVADEILFKGDRYKVITLADWSSFGHNVAMVVKI